MAALVVVLGAYDVAAVASDTGPFVRPLELEPAVGFWRRVYTEATTDGGFIHDDEHLDIVYEILTFSSDAPIGRRSSRIDEAKAKYERLLRQFADGDSEDLTQEAQRVKDLWPKGTSRAVFREAADHVRFQLGQANRFQEGLIRSGAWMPRIAATFERMGLPRELAALPHVESSFNTNAYSKVGAAGMWQFMRSTGRRYLRIDNVVDERLDPYKATEAAARFLEQNYAVLNSWPLALTAYNHGAAGMRRAKEQLGTDDIVTIIRKYDSRSFGFASRNFYTAFLAALEVDSDPDKFFPNIKRNALDSSQIVVLPDFVPARSISSRLNLSGEELRRLNPSLLPSVWNGSKHIPRGFELRLPQTIDLSAALDSIAHTERHEAQVAESRHRVGRGETLASVAAKYSLPVTSLASINNLKKPFALRAGQLLILPGQPLRPVATVAQVEPVRSAAMSPAESITAADPNEGRYIVRRGDTLSKIAVRLGIDDAALMTLNHINDRDFLYEGQVLATTVASASAPVPEATVAVEPAVTAQSLEPPAREAAEPVSKSEAEDASPTLLPGVQAAASADPSDYAVAKDGTIRVEAAETLGHYAQWLEVVATDIRKLNRMSKATPVVIGRRIKLDFARIDRQSFEAKRVAYHKELEEAFFAQFRIAGSDTHTVQRGESIWNLAQKRYNVPIWLLRQYNPDVDLGDVRPGVKLVIPRIEAANTSTSAS